MFGMMFAAVAMFAVCSTAETRAAGAERTRPWRWICAAFVVVVWGAFLIP